MKIIVSPVLILSLLLVFSGTACVNQDENNDKILTVSIQPVGYFVQKIAGDEFKINVIVPPGASPATYEPPPSVIRNLSESRAVIYNGYLGFEQAWMNKLQEVNPGIATLYLAENQELIAAESHRHGDHVHLSGVDPHFWVSPLSARIIALDIYNFLNRLYPEKKELFTSGYNSLLSEIEAVDKYAVEILGPLVSRKFIIFHPALAYLARDYKLEQVAIELDGKEPSASWISKVIGLARQDEIQVILVQQEFNKSSAEIIADESGARVVEIFPLSADWPGATREIIDAIAQNDNINIKK